MTTHRRNKSALAAIAIFSVLIGIAMPASAGLERFDPQALRRGVWKDQLIVLSGLRDEPRIEEVFKPADERTITDPALDFDASRLMFAMEGEQQRNWRIFEIGTDGSGLRQVTPDDGRDVAHFDPCCLADGNLLFTSTAGFMGLPCVFGSTEMVCTYRMERATGKVRQLTFEQDSNWSPTPLANGRVLYQRWEYSGIAHSNSRLLMHMNPLSSQYHLVAAKPAPNTPIAIQALDDKGQALQVMRSWTVAMPGENASCIGCRESQNEAPPLTTPVAALREPSRIRSDLERVASGGSRRDRPRQSTASYRRPYRPYQRVFNVGFRLVSPGRYENNRSGFSLRE